MKAGFVRLAAAIAVLASVASLAGCAGAASIATPTQGGTGTPTRSATATPTPTSVPSGGTPTPTATSSLPTATPTPAPSKTPTPTSTPVGTPDTSGFATPTPTPTPTATPLPQAFETGPLANSSILFARSGSPSKAMSVHPTGRDEKQLGTGVNGILNPRWSPDGTKVAFTAVAGDNVRGFVIADKDGAVLARQGQWACLQCTPFLEWSPFTPVLYVTNNNGLMTHFTDSGALTGGEGSGPSASLPSNLQGFSGLNIRGSDWLVSSKLGSQWDLFSNLGNTQLTNSSWDEIGPRWSPNGTKVAFASNQYGQYDIFVLTVGSNQLSRLTATPGDDIEPAWSQDGQFIVFSSERSGNYDLYIMADSGEGSFLQQVTDTPEDDRAPDWH